MHAFIDYKKMHEACRDHIKYQWHQEAMAAPQDFIDVMAGGSYPLYSSSTGYCMRKLKVTKTNYFLVSIITPVRRMICNSREAV